MKPISFGIMLFFGGLVLCSAAGIVEDARRGSDRADLSYAFGMLIGSDLAETGMEFNYDAFMRGFRDTMESGQTQFTFEEAVEIINTAFMSQRAEISDHNLAMGTVFLADNSKRPEVFVSPSGLQYEVITEGTGLMPGPMDTVLVHYLGRTIDGTVFDTTYDRGFAAEIPLDRVIPGWSEGLRLMREGGRAILYIPSRLAYGESGAGTLIGPNAVIIFEIELIAISQSFYEIEDSDEEWHSLLDD